MFNHKIADRPATDKCQWIIDFNEINELPDVAIVAVVQSIDLKRLSAPTFHAIVAIVDNEIRRRQQLTLKGQNK
jgi:hypothetical protein